MTYDELNILYEDNQIIVVLKPQGIASCPDESGDANLFDLISEYIKVTYNKPGNVYLGLVHRLDRPTGGVMVYAKTSKAAARLCTQFAEHKTEKRYLAVAVGSVAGERGRLVNYLKKNPINNMVYITTETAEGAKLASLDYKVLADKKKLTLLEIMLHTGRSHQIRVQLAGTSHPVYGDMRYGGVNAVKGNLALWAYSLKFEHPVTKEKMRFVALPPADGNPWSHFDLASVVEGI